MSSVALQGGACYKNYREADQRVRLIGSGCVWLTVLAICYCSLLVDGVTNLGSVGQHSGHRDGNEL